MLSRADKGTLSADKPLMSTATDDLSAREPAASALTSTSRRIQSQRRCSVWKLSGRPLWSERKSGPSCKRRADIVSVWASHFGADLRNARMLDRDAP